MMIITEVINIFLRWVFLPRGNRLAYMSVSVRTGKKLLRSMKNLRGGDEKKMDRNNISCGPEQTLWPWNSPLSNGGAAAPSQHRDSGNSFPSLLAGPCRVAEMNVFFFLLGTKLCRDSEGKPREGKKSVAVFAGGGGRWRMIDGCAGPAPRSITADDRRTQRVPRADPAPPSQWGSGRSRPGGGLGE